MEETKYFVQRFKICGACSGNPPRIINNGVGKQPTIINCGICGGAKYVPADFVPIDENAKHCDGQCDNCSCDGTKK